MFNITEEAQTYVSDLFAQQDEKDLGLKVDIERAGTPAAAVTFNFCFPKELGKNYFKFAYEGFFAYIDEANFKYLEESEVALKDKGAGKKLTITAPNAKGEEPSEDAPLEEKIKYMIAAEISPGLASHGGFVELVEITKDKDVVLNFGGGCQGCGMVDVTLKNGIEGNLLERFPEVTRVQDVTDHQSGANPYYTS